VAAIRDKTLRESHPYRLVSQNVLATTYYIDGQIEKAVKLLEHVVAVQEKTLREDHPDRLLSERVLHDFRESQVSAGS